MVTDGEQRAALAVVRSLGKKGLRVIVVSEYKSNISAYSKYCYRAYKCHSPFKSENGFIFDIKNIVRREKIHYIVPITDVSMYTLLNPNNKLHHKIINIFPDFKLFSFISDKWKLLKLCQRLEINIPKTYFLEDLFQLEHYQDQLSFPVVIKPSRSLLKINDKWFKAEVKIFDNYEELSRVCYQDVIYRFPFLLQEKVEGAGYGIFALYDQGRVICHFGHKRIREKPPLGGVSVLRESVALNDDMLLVADKILNTVQWHGPAMVEFKYNEQNKQYHLMEINGRFWGSLQLAIDAGVDFPWLLLNPQNIENYKRGIKLRWFLGDLDHHLALAKTTSGLFKKLKTILNFLIYREPNINLEVFRSEDMRPFLCELVIYLQDIFNTLRSSFKKRIVDKITNFLMRYYLKLRVLVDPKRKFFKNKLPARLKKILFICEGNLYRSPFAEHYLKKITNGNLCISSAGLNTTADIPAAYRAIRVAKLYDVDLNNHRLRKVSDFKDEHLDLIFVMERTQKKPLKQYCRHILELGLFGDKNNMSYNIPDPYGKPDEFVQDIYNKITQYLDNFKMNYLNNDD